MVFPLSPPLLSGQPCARAAALTVTFCRVERLFSVRDPMTTEEISRMGFTNVILLNAARWRSDDGGEASASVAAAADIHYCFGMKGEPVDSLVAGNRARMEEMLISGFCGRGDLLIVIQNATDSDSAVDLSEPGLVVVGRLVDMIEKGEC